MTRVGVRGRMKGSAMLRKWIVVVTAALITTALSTPPADARAKKKTRVDAAPSRADVPPSLDGRITGRSRTCGFDTFVYDGKGVPVGPYCH